MQDVILTIATFVPLVCIIWLANLADHQRDQDKREAAQALTAASFGLLALLYAGFTAVGLLLQILGALSGGNLRPELADLYRQLGVDAATLATVLPRIGLGLWVPSLGGIILLLPPVRRLLARVIPIDPASSVHAVALSFSMLILILMFVFLGVGIGNMANLMQSTTARGGQSNLATSIWAQDIMLAIMAAIGVGWLSRKRLGASLVRLGVVIPSLRQIWLGLAVGLAMVPIALLIEYLSGKMGFGTSADVQKLSEQLIGPLEKSIFGILTMGLAAALGEESVFRGALQPRFGIVLTAALFALLHSQYGLSIASVVVFLAGMAMGLVRQRTNTTTSMVVHAVYNMTLGLIAYLNLLQNT